MALSTASTVEVVEFCVARIVSERVEVVLELYATRSALERLEVEEHLATSETANPLVST